MMGPISVSDDKTEKDLLL